MKNKRVDAQGSFRPGLVSQTYAKFKAAGKVKCDAECKKHKVPNGRLANHPIDRR
jgi:hypothetical protein